MIAAGWLWVVFTVLAAAGQSARNAMQRDLTASLGTVGATHVRFLFGFPFALLFSLSVIPATGHALPSPPLSFWLWVAMGAGTQIFATGLMLAAMNDRSFVVTIAYTKTEVIQAAIFGLLFLGDPLTALPFAAILVATGGVWLMSFKAGVPLQGGLRPTLLGLGSGAMLGAVGQRLSRRDPVARFAELCGGRDLTLAVALVLQSALLTLYLLCATAAC
jgi:drug/metabolite transporter (DMT)-like permease